MSHKAEIVDWFIGQGAVEIEGILVKDGQRFTEFLSATVQVDITSNNYQHYYFDDGKEYVDGWCSEYDEGEFTLSDFKGMYFNVFPVGSLQQ